MTSLVSKLQNQDYEAGEFADELPRTLEETLILFNSFPWNEQRLLSNNDLTGASITIAGDETHDYLKVGLHNSDRFVVYYFNAKFCLYQHYVSTNNEVNNLVISLFNKSIDLKLFKSYLKG